MADSTSLFGKITPPLQNQYFTAKGGEGIFLLLSNIFKLVGVVGGIFMIVQFILAGYQYLTASGDPKKTEAAWAKIWQSIVGLLIISSAFILAGVVGRLTGINILNPQFYGPGSQ